MTIAVGILGAVLGIVIQTCDFTWSRRCLSVRCGHCRGVACLSELFSCDSFRCVGRVSFTGQESADCDAKACCDHKIDCIFQNGSFLFYLNPPP